jgi:tRNA nucleotidyltransferase (CCA-adding enzyme)
MEQSENNVYIKMPEDTEKIIKRLHDAGYSAFVVGGCVRDVLQGIEPHDWDVCTSAHPDEVQHIFKDCTVIPTGIKHGTVTVMTTEVTTFRREGKYTDGRHPDSVAFVKDIKEDLFRRDFTVNAMAYSPYEGLVDPFGGQEDLKNGILRCVSEPHRCFSDDALRILRAVRFMSTKGFKADEAAAAAVKSDYRLLKNISMERIRDEFVKFLCGDGVADLLDEYREVFCFIIPELKAMIGFDQRSPYHNRDVWHHTLCAVADIPPEPVLRVTMLLHDIAKPVVCIIDDNGRGRFQGHPAKGAEMAEVILRRMKFSKKIINHVVTLIRYHDLKIKPERSDVRRWLGRMGMEIFDELMYVRHADASGKYEKYLGEAEMKNARLTEIADEIETSGDCTDLKGLAVDGSDVREAGYSGADTGKALEWLLEEVITERVPNEKEALLAALNRKEIFNLCQNGV